MSGLKPYVELVWSLLLKHCECQEEGTRNVVAECLGKLTLIDPETLLPRLKVYLLSGNQYPDQRRGLRSRFIHKSTSGTNVTMATAVSSTLEID